ncbi:MAG: hypothetical protein FGM45_07120 [Actinobacteria bacterium]|nr:hypothetical protein [Actinomycetota bacterium]
MTHRELATIAAELAVMAEGTDRYFDRVRELGSANLGEHLEDLMSAIHEAERALRSAHRALARASRIAS